MTPEQEKALIEAVRFLLRTLQQSSRFEARRIAKGGHADVDTHDRIRELMHDADLASELLKGL